MEEIPQTTSGVETPDSVVNRAKSISISPTAVIVGIVVVLTLFITA